MTKDKFLEILSRKKYNSISIGGYRNDYDEVAIRKMIGENINFGCDFKDGKCKNKNPIGQQKDEMCCCKHCHREIGYLRHILFKDLGTIAEAWDSKTGFWRKNTGCQLPYHLRSNTCIFYNCSPDKVVRHGLSSLRTLLSNAASRDNR